MIATELVHARDRPRRRGRSRALPRRPRPRRPARDVTVVGNVGDDFEHLGLHVSPDLDTVLYTLAGVVDSRQVGDGPTRPRTRSATVRRWAARTGSSSAIATSAFMSSARSACVEGRPSRRSPRTSHAASMSGCASCRRRRPGADDAADAERLARLPDVLRAPATPGRGSRATNIAGPPRQFQRLASSRRSPAPTSSSSAPSNPFLSIEPILAVAAFERRCRPERAPSSPSARSSPAARSRALPIGCSVARRRGEPTCRRRTLQGLPDAHARGHRRRRRVVDVLGSLGIVAAATGTRCSTGTTARAEVARAALGLAARYRG